MKHASREAAQQRADQVAAFQSELQLLQDEGIVTLPGEQQASLANHHKRLLQELGRDYDIDQNQQARQLSLGLKVASFLGALAMAACVFFLFRQFWGLFGTTAQVAILIATALLAWTATAAIAHRDSSGYYVKLAALVALACFILNIVLLGAIFNLTPSENSLLVWAIAALLLAYGHDVRLLLGAGLLCLMAYLSARMGTFSGIYWLGFGERPEHFIVLGAAIFLLPLIVDQPRYPGFGVIYRVFGLISLLTAVLMIGHWGGASYLPWPTAVVEGFYQILGFVFSGLAIWLGLRWGYADTVNTGNVFFVLFLYTKFFDWWWDFMPKYLFFLILSLTAILCMLIFKRLRVVENRNAGGAQS